jgi:hypothetical protein
MGQDRCKHCDRVVEFVDVFQDGPEGPTTTRVALDPKTPTYVPTESGTFRLSHARAPHWATCPVGREKVVSKKTFAEVAKELDEKTENEPWWNKY